MMAPVLSVQARMGSTRLPGKVLLPLGPRRTLGWVCERSRISDVGDIWVTTSQTDCDAAITEWCDRNDVRYLRGPEKDLLDRHLAVADRADAETVIRINADCPFVPPDEIDRVWSAHHTNDAVYTTNQVGSAPAGINVDVIDVETLRELKEAGHTHPITPLRGGGYDVVLTEATEWCDFEAVELTLDTPGDYWAFHDAVEAAGGNPRDVAMYLQDV